MKTNRLIKLAETVRRAFVEFLTVPSLIIVGFLLLAMGTRALDEAGLKVLEPVHGFLKERVFRDSKATSDLLGVIAGSIITVTSITFSLLLLAVQQSAVTLTPQVYDQFLRRRTNQIYFGFFVGLALYTLIILATVHPNYNPVFGATLAFLLTIVALCFVILLLYTTIDQMRPAVVIETIRDHVLIAREHHLALLRKTRRPSQHDSDVSTVQVKAERHGFVVRLDMEVLEAAIGTVREEVEIFIKVGIGSFVAFQDHIAEIKTRSKTDADALAEPVRAAICLEEQRDLDTDPGYGINQLETIAWTSISSARSNPSPALMAIYGLRDLLARWCEDDKEIGEAGAPNSAVIYADKVFAQLLDAFESLGVVASDSMQHQTFSEIMRVFAIMFDRLPAAHQSRAEDIVLRLLSSLGDHVLTAELNNALSDLVRALQSAGRMETAGKVQVARDDLAASVGKLGSRATRAAVKREQFGK